MLNERIKELRCDRHLNQVQLGTALGVTKQCISNWENDNIQPSVEMLTKIAKFFNVSCDYLLGLTSERAINADGLSDEQIAHICAIIDDLKKANTQK